MARTRKKTAVAAQTTARYLSSLIKSARDIMRKDKGLNGDLDRFLPRLMWIMFLKFLDEAEMVREGEARLSGNQFRSTIEKPYRWRDWAAQERQRHTVSDLNEILARAGDLQQNHLRVEAELNALLPSILDHAFKGEL